MNSAKKTCGKQLKLYDSYDCANNMSARQVLLTSLSDQLKRTITEKIEDSDPFPVVWLMLIKTVCSTSIERFQDLKVNIKYHDGEDLAKLIVDFRADALELTTTGQYDHNLTSDMLKSFLLAGGEGNENFYYPLRGLLVLVDEALLDIGCMEKDASDKNMIKNNLTYKAICQKAEDQYCKLYDQKQWPPAKHARDSKAPPASFGAHVAQSEFLTLTQSSQMSSASPSGPTKVSCHKCGKSGHWCRDCPQGGQHGGLQIENI